MGGEPPCECGGPQVPGDVPPQLLGRQTEAAQRRRYAVARVIAQEHHRGAAAGVDDLERRRVIRAEQRAAGAPGAAPAARPIP